jgi:hypothetical protein
VAESNVRKTDASPSKYRGKSRESEHPVECGTLILRASKET